jgi:nitroimidazol reductase NimA-like FMN-containing flavoprotein (pyridoxamine 5'-phosphate oxidase superfamily)
MAACRPHPRRVSTTERSQLRRITERGSREAEVIHPILDAAFLAHVGFEVSGQPFVIPMTYGRKGDTLYLHGSAVSRLLTALDAGVPACVTVTLIDGLVLARSAFHHSMNYRSVVAFGTGRKILSPSGMTRALRVISEHMLAGRWRDVRGPTRAELAQTTVIEFCIEEASAKCRAGPPVDDEDDYGRSTWAGLLPLALASAAPQPDPRLPADVEPPPYLMWPRR